METANRVQQIIVRHSNPDYRVYSKMGHKANNIYNLATYYARQWFFKEQNVSTAKLDRQFKHMNATKQNCLYTQMNVHLCQHILKRVNDNFKAFFQILKQWKRTPNKFTGRPRIPKYHKKGSMSAFVIDNQDFHYSISEQVISWLNDYHSSLKQSIWWKRYLHDIRLDNQFNIAHIGQIIVVPKRYYVKLLVEYQVRVPDERKDNGRYMSIDPGVNNLLCCGFNHSDCKSFIINGRLLKSINQYANKRIAQTRSCLMKCNHQYTSHYLDFLFTKRHFKLYYLCHEASKYVIEYALNHDISRIVIGAGATRSKRGSKMGKRNNQNYIQIPFGELIQDIQYKAGNVGIKVIITEESYTSQSSFLDNEQPCKFNGNLMRHARGIKNWKRRIKRGLFKADNGELINADLNGALQIMKKVYPKAFNTDGLEGLVSSPVKINL